MPNTRNSESESPQQDDDGYSTRTPHLNLGSVETLQFDARGYGNEWATPSHIVSNLSWQFGSTALATHAPEDIESSSARHMNFAVMDWSEPLYSINESPIDGRTYGLQPVLTQHTDQLIEQQGSMCTEAQSTSPMVDVSGTLKEDWLSWSSSPMSAEFCLTPSQCEISISNPHNVRIESSSSPQLEESMRSSSDIRTDDNANHLKSLEYFDTACSSERSKKQKPRTASSRDSVRQHAYYRLEPSSDGLYHCPFTRSQGCDHRPVRLRCDYNKYLDTHFKPYYCKDEACRGHKLSSAAGLLRHEREAHGLHGHGLLPFRCQYQGCLRSEEGRGFPRKWNLQDHMRRVHKHVSKA